MILAIKEENVKKKRRVEDDNGHMGNKPVTWNDGIFVNPPPKKRWPLINGESTVMRHLRVRDP